MSLHWPLSIQKQKHDISKSSGVLAMCWLWFQPLLEGLSRLCAPLPAVNPAGPSAGACSVWLQNTPLCICFVYWGKGFLYIYFGRGSGWEWRNNSISLSQNNVCKSPWSILCVSARVWVRAWECLTSYSLCVLKICELYFFFSAEAIVNKKRNCK